MWQSLCKACRSGFILTAHTETTCPTSQTTARWKTTENGNWCQRLKPWFGFWPLTSEAFCGCGVKLVVSWFCHSHTSFATRTRVTTGFGKMRMQVTADARAQLHHWDSKSVSCSVSGTSMTTPPHPSNTRLGDAGGRSCLKAQGILISEHPALISRKHPSRDAIVSSEKCLETRQNYHIAWHLWALKTSNSGITWCANVAGSWRRFSTLGDGRWLPIDPLQYPSSPAWFRENGILQQLERCWDTHVQRYVGHFFSVWVCFFHTHLMWISLPGVLWKPPHGKRLHSAAAQSWGEELQHHHYPCFACGKIAYQRQSGSLMRAPLALAGSWKTQLSGTQFDKTTTRSEYWEVPFPLCILNREHLTLYVCVLLLLSLVVLLRNWVWDNRAHLFPTEEFWGAGVGFSKISCACPEEPLGGWHPPPLHGLRNAGDHLRLLVSCASSNKPWNECMPFEIHPCAQLINFGIPCLPRVLAIESDMSITCKMIR